jgi:UDP-2,4-diacetamido-2,4,6-trideoxy-beta-L-altropyranose hydrolase
MRCLTLARALVGRGAECAFVESRAAAPILRRFGWPAQTVLAMTGAQELPDLVRFGCEFADRFEADMVVVDHYRAGAAEEAALRGVDRRIVAIDDLADRRHACDVLVDPGYGRRRDQYAGLVGDACVALMGPGHALVRPEFGAARQRALGRRAKHDPVRRALIALGLTDVGGVTGRIVAALARVAGEVRLDVALSAQAPSLPALRAAAISDRRLHLWIDTDEMASLMADADIAVGAGGSSVWERATVGLPSVTVILAENQRAMAGHLAEARVTMALDADPSGFESRLGEAWTSLVADRGLRWRLTERSAELCDGHGAERVADALLRSWR